MKFLFALLFITHSFNSWSQNKGELLDKILAVVNDEVVTLSMVKRIEETSKQRLEISGRLYEGKYKDTSSIVSSIIDSYLIRNGIKDIGYVVNDEQVENTVNSRQKSLGLTRESLIQSLRAYGISFEEYFEIIRQSLEYNVFIQRIIIPLISITDQEIKNAYSKTNTKSVSTFKYDLIDYSISKKLSKPQHSSFLEAVKVFHEKKILAQAFREIEEVEISDVNEDALSKNLQQSLSQASEGSFTTPLLVKGRYHVYYVKKKSLSESYVYSENKEEIRQGLIGEAAISMQSIWLKREANKHYIKYFIE